MVFSEAVEALRRREPWIAIFLDLFGLFPQLFSFFAPCITPGLDTEYMGAYEGASLIEQNEGKAVQAQKAQPVFSRMTRKNERRASCSSSQKDHPGRRIEKKKKTLTDCTADGTHGEAKVRSTCENEMSAR